MSKAWICICLMAASSFLNGCTDTSFYVDAQGNRFGASQVKCITAPIGYVVPDDVYTAKYGQPWGIRCQAGMIAAVVVDDPDGNPIDVPVIPKPPGPTPGKPGSVFAGVEGAAAIDAAGNTAIASSENGYAFANGTTAQDALNFNNNLMRQIQNDVNSQVSKDLGQ